MSADTGAAAPATATTTAASGAGLLGGEQGAPAAVPSTVTAVNTAAQNDAAAKWAESIADPTLKAYVIGKQWKDGTDAANGYMHLEKLLGSEKLPMPKGEADAEGWNRVYKAIGRPETPDGYKLPVPATGGDPAFATEASKQFHEAGLSTKQANAIAKWYSEFGGKHTAANDQAIERRNAQQLEEYKREQGTLFDARLEMGRRAAKQFGFTNEELSVFERNFGTKALLTRFSAMGEGLAEHHVSGESSSTAGLSATQAAAQIALLKKDPEFVAQYTGGNADAKTRMFALQAAAAGMTVDAYREAMGLRG